MTSRRILLTLPLLLNLVEPAKVPAKRRALPKLKSRVPRDARPTDTLFMIHSGQMADQYRLTFDGLEYVLGVVGADKRIWHIEVRDRKFATREGIRVGDPFTRACKVPGGYFHALPGCFAYVLLPSGWAAGFWPLEPSPSTEAAAGELRIADLRSVNDVPDRAMVQFLFKSVYTS